MSLLKNIPKERMYEPPKGYFDTLPALVQSRIDHKNTFSGTPLKSAILRYGVLTATTIALAVWYFMSPPNPTSSDAEQWLSSLSVEEVVNYLEEQDMGTEEIWSAVSLSKEEVNELEENWLVGLEIAPQNMTQYIDELNN